MVCKYSCYEKRSIFLKITSGLLAVFVVVSGVYSKFRSVSAENVFSFSGGFGQYERSEVFVPNFNSGLANLDGGTALKSRGFWNPSGIALDDLNNRLFVSDAQNSRVLVFNLNENNEVENDTADFVLGASNFNSSFGLSGECEGFLGTNSPSCFLEPKDLFYDKETNFLFVMDPRVGRVLVFDVSTITNGEDAIYALGVPDLLTGGSLVPSSNSFGSSNIGGIFVNQNYIFIGDGYRVLIFNKVHFMDNISSDFTGGMSAEYVLGQDDTESFLSPDGGPSMNNFYSVSGIFLYEKYLFISDYSFNRILVFNAEGGFLNNQNALYVIGQNNLGVPDFSTSSVGYDEYSLYGPTGIFVDENGVLFVSEKENNRVSVFANIESNVFEGSSASASYVLGTPQFSDYGGETSQSRLNSPFSVFVYISKLFVSDLGNNRILIFDILDIENGENAVSIMGQGGYEESFGNEFLFEQGFANSGDQIDDLSIYSFGLRTPVSIAIDPNQHLLFVADVLNYRVIVHQLDENNNLIDKEADYVIGQNSLSEMNSYQSPNDSNLFYSNSSSRLFSSIQIDLINHRLFISDPSRSRVLVFSSLIENLGNSAIAVLGQDNFETENTGNTDNTMNSPMGILLKHNDLFVSDTLNNRVLVFDVSDLQESGQAAYAVIGQSNFTNNSFGLSSSSMYFPTGLAFFNSYLFVADSGNNRILVFDIEEINSGNEDAVYVLGQEDFNSNNSGTTEKLLTKPSQLLIDKDAGVLFVSESFFFSGHDFTSSISNRVLAFDVKEIENNQSAVGILGQQDFVSTIAGTNQEKLNSPSGMYLDSEKRRLYIADTGNNRVVWIDMVDFSLSLSNNGQVGLPYEESASFLNNQGQVELSLFSGTMPPGLYILSDKIQGIPTVAGVYEFAIRAKDFIGDSGYLFSKFIEFYIEIEPSSGNDSDGSPGGDGSSTVGSTGGQAGGGELAINSPPFVKIINPTYGSIFNHGQIVQITAEANDFDGFIKKVEILIDGVVKSTFTSPPFIFETSALPLGNRKIKARAFDEKGAFSVSDEISISIKEKIVLPADEEIPNDENFVSCIGNNCVNLDPTHNVPKPSKNISDSNICPQGVINSVLCEIKNTFNYSKFVLGESFESVLEIIRSPYGNFLTKTISSVGLIFGAIFTLLPFLFLNPLSFSEIFLIPARLWSAFLSVFGIRQRTRKWGVVYDSVTKRPLDPVYVSLQNIDGQEIASSITDIDGRYGFMVSPGRYRIIPQKTNYSFPSLKVVGKTRDEIYSDLYFGYVFEVKKEGEVISKNIPMDPKDFDWNEFAKNEQKLTVFYSRRNIWLNRISDVAFSVGMFFAVLAAVSAPVWYNLIILTLYVILLIFREYGLRQKRSSTLIKKGTHIPVAFAIVRVFDLKTKTEISRKVTDKIGKFFALVKNGKYFVTVETKNDKGKYEKPITIPEFEVKDGIIDRNFEI